VEGPAAADQASDVRSAPGSGAQFLHADALQKSFGATRALVTATLGLRTGTIVGMVGENGSGKSTLVKILSGLFRPDGGRITLGDRDITRMSGPAAAAGHGIATVFQEVLVSRSASVLDNIFLGYDPLWRARLSVRERRRLAQRLLGELSGSDIKLDAPAESLPLSQQQTVVTARALVREPRFVILDEATSALDISERDQVFAHCRRLRTDGRAILFITHRMEELLALADEIVVIRDGETVEAIEKSEATPTMILDLMTGGGRRSEAQAQTQSEQRSSAAPLPGEGRAQDRRVVLSAAEVRFRESDPIDFSLYAGSIVGLAGLDGHGQEEFLQALAGLRPPRSGDIWAHEQGGESRIRSRFEAQRHGIVHLPRNRVSQGIFPPLSILDNFGLPTYRQDERLGVIRRRSLLERFAKSRTEMHIKLASPDMPITSLSGGNQQKVLLARWLAAKPRVLLLDDPTRGVDLATKREIHGILRLAAADGVGVVVLSTELEELEELCDQVVVFHEGNLVARLEHSRVTRDDILAAMFGVG
jgi:ABC-type sugar transport system ATPase subunit